MSLRAASSSIARNALRPSPRSLRAFASTSSSSADVSVNEAAPTEAPPVMETNLFPRNSLYKPKAEDFLRAGPMYQNRLLHHYETTVAPSLLYMTYEPPWTRYNSNGGLDGLTSPPTSQSSNQRGWDPSSPYSQNRPARPLRGNRMKQPGAIEPNFENPSEDIPRLESVVVSAFSSASLMSKSALVPLVAQLRAITGVSPQGTWADPAQGLGGRGAAIGLNGGRGHLEIIRAKKNIAPWRLRKGMPCGVKAVLPPYKGLEFLDVLLNFVWPRLRGFRGVSLPSASEITSAPPAMSGVVSFGFGPEAIPLFPQVEVNLDAYPGKSPGFSVDFITNQRGPRASHRARQLMSGLGVPFVRRGT